MHLHFNNACFNSGWSDHCELTVQDPTGKVRTVLVDEEDALNNRVTSDGSYELFRATRQLDFQVLQAKFFKAGIIVFVYHA